ncbi:MAG: pyrroline-5-carboxylate reductase [Clostridia bacterium]|nr:pyrroline-5-carboxylate reductase [Clostridia bacterium]
MSKSIGFIGAGNMGGAIIGGISGKGLYDEIRIFDKDTAKAGAVAAKYGASACSLEQTASADVVLLAVKPNVLINVLRDIESIIRDDVILISIAAGQNLYMIDDELQKEYQIHLTRYPARYGIKVMRAMPNTPALVGEGMTALSPNWNLEKDKEAIAEVVKIFECLGRVEIVPESLMDAVTGVSGSSPAYVFMFIEALADAAVKAGMPRDKSYIFAAQSVLGAAKMVLETGRHPAELKDMVCSPNGTTIEAVKVLEEKGFRAAVMDAVDACVKKSESM